MWTVLGLTLAIGLGVLAATKSDLTAETVADLAARLRPPVLIGAVLAMSLGFVCLALRWRALMITDRPPPIGPLTVLMVIGTMLHFAVPGPVGELAGATLAARRFGIGAEMAFAAGVHARLIGLAMAGIVAVALFVGGGLPMPPGTERWLGVATVVIGGVALGVAALSVAPGLLVRVSEWTVGRVKWLGGLHRSVVRFGEAMGSVGRLGLRRYLLGAWWAFAGHGCVAFGIWVAAKGLGDDPNVVGLVFTYAASTAGAIVLFAFPGSQVGWDAMFVLFLATTAEVPAGDAVALTLLVRVQQLTVILLGVVGLAVWSRNGTAASSG